MSLLGLDQQITGWLYQEQAGPLQDFLLILSGGIIYVLPLLLLILFFRSTKDRIASFKIALSAIFSWKVLSALIGTLIYNAYAFRDRPFAGQGQTELFFEQPQKAFPSDHAAVMASVVVLLYAYGYRRVANIALALTLLSSFGRVMIGFHWFGDVIAGWVVGIIGAAVIIFFDRWLDKIWGWIERKWQR